MEEGKRKKRYTINRNGNLITILLKWTPNNEDGVDKGLCDAIYLMCKHARLTDPNSNTIIVFTNEEFVKFLEAAGLSENMIKREKKRSKRSVVEPYERSPAWARTEWCVVGNLEENCDRAVAAALELHDNEVEEVCDNDEEHKEFECKF